MPNSEKHTFPGCNIFHFIHTFSTIRHRSLSPHHNHHRRRFLSLGEFTSIFIQSNTTKNIQINRIFGINIIFARSLCTNSTLLKFIYFSLLIFSSLFSFSPLLLCGFHFRNTIHSSSCFQPHAHTHKVQISSVHRRQ